MQISRMLGFPYKTAWFMCHRIRESLRETAPESLGGKSKVVEADETYVGGKAKNRKGRVPPKEAVFSLVERDGKVRSRHVADISARTLRAAISTQVDRASYLMTDEAPVYTKIGEEFSAHGTVNHSIEEYVRAYFWHTNTVEGYFSILKRGIMGTFHHVSPQHLHRHLAEFDYRYNEREALGVKRRRAYGQIHTRYCRKTFDLSADSWGNPSPRSHRAISAQLGRFTIESEANAFLYLQRLTVETLISSADASVRFSRRRGQLREIAPSHRHETLSCLWCSV